MNPAMKGLLAADVLIRFCEQIPHAFVVIWCMKTIAEPATAAHFGLISTIEMATAVLVHVPVAYRIEALKTLRPHDVRLLHRLSAGASQKSLS